MMETRTKPLILVVDDESVVCSTLKDILEYSSRYDVVTCHESTQALDFVADCSPNLVLLDIKMPGMSGDEVLDRIRWYDPELPVIMLTAIDNLRMALGGIKSGAVDYLVKPLDIDLITTAVDRALDPGMRFQGVRSFNMDIDDDLLEKWAELEQHKRQLSILDSMSEGYEGDGDAIAEAYDEMATKVEALAQRLRQAARDAKLRSRGIRN